MPKLKQYVGRDHRCRGRIRAVAETRPTGDDVSLRRQ